MAEISFKTATSIARFKGIITEKRFLELTGGIILEDLSQEIAAPLEAHLRRLHEWFSDYGNIISAFIEENDKYRLHNPEAFIRHLTPRLVDTISVRLWEQTEATNAANLRKDN